MRRTVIRQNQVLPRGVNPEVPGLWFDGETGLIP
jgi:hypothetical protein